MTKTNKQLKISHKFEAPVEQVYSALTRRTVLQNWLSDVAEVDVRENGRLFLWWNEGRYAAGKFTEVKENEQLSFSWQGSEYPGPTKVELALEGKNGSTTLTLTHSDFGDSDEWEDIAKRTEEEWNNSLINLQWTLEKGVDKRIYERPFMGILLNGTITESQVEEWGTPVSEGMVLGGTVDGTGAQEAGLEINDVLVKIGESVITDLPSIGAEIAKHKAEDVVPFVIYRGVEKIELDVRLSTRPYPEFPNTGKEFAQTLRGQIKELDKELDAVFEGVSEEAAAKQPAPGEWSAKENVAHLLYGERWLQLAISTAVGGQRGPGWFNENGLIAAIAGEFETTADAVAALKRAEQVTANAFEALPDDFTAEKIRYYNLITWPSQGVPLHSRGHFDQMKAAIEAANQDSS